MRPRQIGPILAASLVALAACGSDEAGSSGEDEEGRGTSRPLTVDEKKGIATFYDADGSGNCSFDKTPGNLDVTALAFPDYNASASCGACLRVIGPKGEITVRVVDSCPPCEKSGVNLDLSAEAFAKIADPDEGRISIKYQLVSCKVTGNLAYHFKDGSSKYWTAIQVRNHKVPIEKVEYSTKTLYVKMERADYNYFIAESGVGDQPDGLKLRITGTDGQVVDDIVKEGVQDDKTVTGTKQFQ